MEPDKVSSKVREMNSADALVENTAIDDRLFHGIEWRGKKL